MAFKHTPVHLTEGERAELQALADQGELPKNVLKEHDEIEARAVYGFDAKKDRHGNWLEQGIGSKWHETSNHFNSIRKYESKEAYEAAVREIQKRDPKRHAALGLPKLKEPA